MFFTLFFLFLSLLSFYVGLNNLTDEILTTFFPNANWHHYSSISKRNIAYNYSFIFCFLTYSLYKYEYVRHKNIFINLKIFLMDISFSFLKKIKNFRLSLSNRSITVMLLIFFGGFFRASIMSSDITYDEAANYLTYCDGGLSDLLKWWGANTHIFHTILMRISIELFGISEVFLRIPSFLFGIANLYLIYSIGEKLSGWRSGIFSLFLYSLFPVIIFYESIARGYSMKITFSLLLFSICLKFLNKPKLVSLIGISFISSLGFFTIFSFIFPFLGLMIWLTYKLTQRKHFSKKTIINCLFFIIIHTGIFSFILYTPTMIFSNISNINEFLKVAQAGNINVYGSFPKDLPLAIENLFFKFLFFDSILIAGIFSICIGYSFIFKKRNSVFLAIQIISSLLLIFIFQAIFPSRVFIYLVPFIIINSSILFSKLSLFLRSKYLLVLPLLQILAGISYGGKFIEYYHPESRHGVKEVIERMKDIPSNSKVLVPSGYIKTFKFYFLTKKVITVESYNDFDTLEFENNKQNTYVIAYSSKTNSNQNLTRILSTKGLKVFKYR